ncbi:MAG TPA: type 2 isopentenyl-diphosphate Delta-isomerase [Candidatus Limosilactobacillus merdipullorum]|uniref:Isopentenyl-diphosphate delta-isomerase n=1 Tax=Candidatus Limosilactobacillus merdipullorum TaxID=2838653 RepID=A0A9D1QNS8_9LACO|nr:type 2 isopentenyl-diphosphate Delta-isomerase [Candidatus Limosilactobacillus merdipullorum]
MTIDSRRKDEHLRYAELTNVAHQGQATDFSQVRLLHQALPELALDEVDVSTNLIDGVKINYPFYIEAMTGGSKKAGMVNRQLATIAARHQLAMATGSMSIIFKDPATKPSFEVIRQQNPTGIVLGNLSANATIDQAAAAIKLVNADALEIHLNSAQEIVMPEGATSYHWLQNISQLARRFPIIVKEVGFGMTKDTVKTLVNAGVAGVNVSGRGGTNFAEIENQRGQLVNQPTDWSTLDDWGQSTVESLLEARSVDHPDATIIASGGVKSAADVVKAGALGASAVGVAGFFLHQLQNTPQKLDQVIDQWCQTIRAMVLLTGCRSFNDLPQVPVVLSPRLESYARQRHLKIK